jgi:hypothetical protein
MNVVISQPMFFPWVGMFEQIRLADVYVHYPDVQFSKGSFVNRVQIKTPTGIKWLTVPLQNVSLGMTIEEICINNQKDWRNQHMELLKQSYSRTPFFSEMLQLVEQVYSRDHVTIGQLSEHSLAVVVAYFGLGQNRRFLPVGELDVSGSSSQRVLDIVKKLEGTDYITGLGALKYLDHELFDAAGIKVSYMNYNKTPYPQQHGDFTPYVSILDLIANTGVEGKRYLASDAVYWRTFVNHE